MPGHVTPTIASLVLACFAGSLQGQAQTAKPAPNDAIRKPEGYNLSKERLAIEGYDPVAYFPEGGGVPAKGDKRFELTHDGVVYRFVSQAHRDLFKANPAKYEPAHGGWCTYAMAKDGAKVEVDPRSFVVAGSRLFLFYKSFFHDTRASFLKDQAPLTAAADANWKKLTGESPRPQQ